MSEKFLKGKGVLITGGASGFGRGVANEFAKRGADLVLVDINEELLEETSKKIEQETKSKIIPIICDVSDSKQVKKMSEQTFNELENVYILFNNAGTATQAGSDIMKISEKAWDTTFNVNLKGQWLVDKTVCRKMNRQKMEPLRGKVIHTTSIAGMVVDDTLSAYSISKAGIIALTQLMARTLAPFITSNAIAPGYHITGIYANSEDTVIQSMKMSDVKTPLNRIGTVEDVVNLMVFLASPRSNFITGHVFPIDGGIAEVGVPPHSFKEWQY
ncbi:MAG: SDR family oxidoreductase [Candidatus Lokiarchaeota archaeon]|nr:SDR family oxidoreductase [Candidatus Lokiarchaeota archaeon]